MAFTELPPASDEKAIDTKERDTEKEAEVDATVVQAGESHGFHPGEGKVKRGMKARHMSMMALGGTIGTGLFVGSGQALATGGPLGALLGYSIMGCVIYSMMVALGEMATLYPDSGSFTNFATRFLDPALGFATGWNYWYSYALTIPTELTAAAIVVNYWQGAQGINPAAFMAPLFVALVLVNVAGVRAFGELEYWFSLIKIIAIVGLIIVGIAINCGAGPGTDGYQGFKLWHNPGAIAQFIGNDGTEVPGSWGRFIAWWAVLVQASFSFLGVEITAVAAGEVENPRRNVPRAIKAVFYRILVFYVLAILVMGLNVAYDDPELLSDHNDTVSASPFVIAINRAKIKALPSIINAVLLIAAWSAGNSDLYASSRTLYALAIDRKAPAIFRRCTKQGLPAWCVAITSLFGFLCFLNVGGTTAVDIFNWLYNLSTITGLITWEVILCSYLRMYYGMKHQNISREDLPYRAPFQPYLSWFGAIFMFLVIMLNGFNAFVHGFDYQTFLAAYISLPAFGLIYLGYKMKGGYQQGLASTGWFNWTQFVTLEAMDFETGRRAADEDQARDEAAEAAKPTSKWSKAMDYIF